MLGKIFKKKSTPKVFWVVRMTATDGRDDLWWSFPTKEEAEKECEKHDGKWTDSRGVVWSFYVDEDREC